MQLTTWYRSHFPLFWLSYEPFAVSRIKDLSTYLIYLSLVLASDRRRCRFRRGVGDDLLRSIEERKFEKTPASTKRRGALNILPGRTATYPGPVGGFCPGTFVRSFRITRTPVSCRRQERWGVRGVFLSRGTIRERNEGDLAGIDEWLFIAAENIPVIRLLSMEKRNSPMRVSNGNPVRHRCEFSCEKITRNYYRAYKSILTCCSIFIISCYLKSKVNRNLRDR